MRYRNIVVLTGAGISAESGLKTFRDHDGLWEGYRVEEVATPEAFARAPHIVHRFYNERRSQLQAPSVQPNTAHRALADFEAQFAGEFTLVTQNIDDLHQRAGSKQVWPMHGELLSARCVHCAAIVHWLEDIGIASRCPLCSNCGNLRPHVVWFGELPLHMDAIEQALRSCDLFVSIGTSSMVYPAAGFQQLAQAVGAHTVELNLVPGATGGRFHETFYGPATAVVPRFFADLRQSV
jgi:NAD-dependent deacetylase